MNQFRILAGMLLPLVFAASDLRSQETPLLPKFHRTTEFAEQVRWGKLASGVRVYVNAPLEMNRKNRRLVIFATPNGNTIEQTLGCAMTEGRDWHFDIQHVAAQIRRLREASTEKDTVLAVVQAPKLSWPAFRQAETNHRAIIHGLVDDLAKEVSAERIALSCHSGGGSFIFGYLNSAEAIPANIERIVFLDANYSYSDEDKHGDKLLAWLNGDTSRHLVVIAYDDREITLNGKKVVGPTGGTFRASGRMIDRFSKEIELPTDQHGAFEHRLGIQGQIEFFIHSNPDNKILHTALVGEMNGLLQGLTLGTDQEKSWGNFGGPRAYERWIQKEPSQENEPTREGEAPAEPSRPNLVSGLAFPRRQADAATGSQFSQQIETLSRDDREAAVLKEVLAGNIPNFLRSLVPIDVEATDSQGVKHTATYHVAPDYLAIGTNEDFFRIPMTPMTATKIAAVVDASLITTKVSDDIFQHAQIRLDPKPLVKDRDAAKTFYEHHQIIEEQRRGRQPLQSLIAGIKKDVVLTKRLNEKPHRVAIYGWHYPTGKPIQPLYVGHVDWYVDYSHGIRLMSQNLIMDGQPRRVEDILKDKQLSVLLSNEGPIEIGY